MGTGIFDDNVLSVCGKVVIKLKAKVTTNPLSHLGKGDHHPTKPARQR